MSYLGRSPSQATRARYYFTATGGETSLSGADDNGNTLVFSDGNFVDVMLNGVTLVAGTDYNTTTTNTIGGLTALTASDIVEIVVYDTFSVFGGDVKGNFNVQNGTLTAETVTASGLVTAQDGLVVDNDGATVATFDRATSDGTIVEYQKDGTTVGSIGSSGGNIYIEGDASASKVGLEFRGSAVYPRDSGSPSDGTTHLGGASNRWNDLYLSGGVYLGGTGAANKLDYYEEGDWTPTDDSGAGLTFVTALGQYIRIGNMVYCYAIITYPSTSDSNDVSFGGLPFAVEPGGLSGQVFRYGGFFSSNNSGTDMSIIVRTNETARPTTFSGAAPISNATLSGAGLKLVLIYTAEA